MKLGSIDRADRAQSNSPTLRYLPNLHFELEQFPYGGTREAFFSIPSTQGRLNGLVGGRPPRKQTKRETSRKRTAGAVDDQNVSKIASSKTVQKNAIFVPLKTNGRANGNQKKAFPQIHFTEKHARVLRSSSER